MTELQTARHWLLPAALLTRAVSVMAAGPFSVLRSHLACGSRVAQNECYHTTYRESGGDERGRERGDRGVKANLHAYAMCSSWGGALARLHYFRGDVRSKPPCYDRPTRS